MVDLHGAMALHGFADESAPRPPSMCCELMAPGVVHVDHDDPDHVFRVTVEEIPRLHLDIPTAAAVVTDGVEVRVTSVVVDNYLTVRLDGVGSVADATAAEHHRAAARWATDERPGSEREAPPTWPAERLTAKVQVTITDDVGTSYDFTSGHAGGDDSPWGLLRRHLPTPPPDATTLRVRLRVAGEADVEVDVPLRRA